MKKQIKFYRVNEPFGDFANFDTKHPIVMGDKTWKSTEHYFQAMKFLGSESDMDAVFNAPKPRDSAFIGRDRDRPLRKDWESVKDGVMYEAVLAKVDQHPDFKELLVSTGDAELIEHTKNDSYWADGGDGTGKNMLGIILMDIRDKIR